MKTSTQKPLLVLNASAGSGKTFNLVRNYLRLLLTNDASRADLGQIVAMTFTNKAAFEMKSRIVSELSELANGENSNTIYLTEMSELLKLSAAEVQKNARTVLKKMLHRYEDFNVMTIDKFNLRLIRSFSRDLNLPEQFQVVMDENMILEKAIDELLNTINPSNRNKIYEFAIHFAKGNLDEENNWEIKKALKEAATILNNERFFDIIKKLTQKEFTSDDLDRWKGELTGIETQAKNLLNELKKASFASTYIENDFVGKSQVTKPLSKLLNIDTNTKQVFQFLHFTPAFISNIEKTIEKNGNDELLSSILHLSDFWMLNHLNWYVLDIKVNQFYILSILRELALMMDSIREKDAIIRISEFNKLVAELVGDEDAPFIYERLGNRYSHFFLDEFQDTSRLQWMNLVPLLHDSLSQLNFNFIVGDPKQSIYRFKNGVAEQFVSLPRIFNPEMNPLIERKSDFFESLGEVDGLTENWRSAENIVLFNNQFFEDIKHALPEQGQLHYNQISQTPRGKKGGFIQIELEAADSDEDLAVLKLNAWVDECISDGYKAGDICILARKKADCNKFANSLKKNGYTVVSSDSLMVNSDEKVRYVMTFCKWRSNPNEGQFAMRFAELYFRITTPELSYANYSSCFENVIRENSPPKKVFSTALFFEKSGFNSELLSSGYPSLYSLIQSFLRDQKLDELDNAYLHQLLEIAFQFDSNYGPDLMAFIEHYNHKGKETNVQLPENKDSIKIMTAHKSKGLEFPVVIIPNLQFDSSSKKKNNIIIEHDDHFISTSLTTKDAIISPIDSLKLEEENATIIDGMNLLYVAFTRPVDRLYALGLKTNQKNGLLVKIEAVLMKLFPASIQNDCIQLKIGEKPVIKHTNEPDSNRYRANSEKDFLWFPEISLQSIEELEANELSVQQRLGQQFHSVMENSHSKETALKFLSNNIRSGKIELIFESELTQLIASAFEDENLRLLFESGIHLDERTLILDQKTRLRPDKIIVSKERTIVIDFKTGEQLAKHRKQVSDYAFGLSSIGYSNVEGYIYYVGRTELVKIELN